MNPIFTSKDCLNYTLLIPINHLNLWSTKPNAWNHPSGMNSVIVGLGTIDPIRMSLYLVIPCYLIQAANQSLNSNNAYHQLSQCFLILVIVVAIVNFKTLVHLQ